MLGRRLRFGLLIVLSCLSGYALLADEIRGFVHAAHLEEGAECTDCHQPSSVRFPHKAHVDSLECNDCHAPSEGSAEPDRRAKASYEACTECHNENDIELDKAACAKCHGVKMRLTAPPDHKKAWLARHGRESEWRVFEKHGRKCSLCHQSNVCITCHQSQKPASHTGLWRIRTHGSAASWDRNRCKTCHETGTCIQCHTTTPPINHTGSWGSTHILVAQTAGNERCAVCHSLVRPCAGCHAMGR